MYIITVIPIERGVLSKELSYFSKNDIDLGSIVTIPIRKKNILGLVIEKNDAQSSKLDIKNLPYKLKKASELKIQQFFSPYFLKAAQDISKYHIATLGQTLEALTPKKILENADKLLPSAFENNKKEDNISWEEGFVIQGSQKERLSTYKSLIREEFAKGNSIFFCLPTISDIEHIVSKLGHGIDEYTVILHNNLSKKVLISNWSKILSSKHPVLIIGTGIYLSVPRDDMRVFIIDKENSHGYKNARRPYIDIRLFAEYLARCIRGKIIFGDVALRIETIYKKEQGIYTKLSPFKYRFSKEVSTHIIDMREYKNETNFRIISDDLKKIIQDGQETGENTVLLINRKGISPETICADCNNIITCKNCNIPVVLHKIRDSGKSNAKNIYICHKCHSKRYVTDKCEVCGGWRLKELGIGIDKVEDELKSIYPKAKIFRLDGDSVKTGKEGAEIVKNFMNTKSSILLGTEMILYYLHEKVSNIGIISIDPLFSIPDYRISERIFNILLLLSLSAQNKFIIQTRNADENIFKYIKQGSLIDFYRHEIEERKNFKYPPFSVLVKISRNGPYEKILNDIKGLAENLNEYNPEVFPGFTSKIKGYYNMHILIKIGVDDWPNKKLTETLQKLPPSYLININPENILN